MKRASTFFALVALSFAAANAQAQLASSKQLVGLFREVIAKPNQSTVRVKADGKDLALGVIVSEDGWILSKYSQLKDKTGLVCRLPDGRDFEPEVFGHDEPFDLVMLKVDTKGLTPIVWTDSKVSKVGHWVASVGTSPDPVAIGVVSVATREIKGARIIASGVQGGYMGVGLDMTYPGVKIQEVMPKEPASKAGLKAEDQILAVNGEKLQSAEDFQAYLSHKKAGDDVTLQILRKDEELKLKVTLGERPGTKGGKSKGDQQNNMGSKLSDRRTGFPVILQHDSIVKPADCGGPLVNLDGKVVGINICRAGRTESYAIPSESIRPLVERLKTRNADTKEEKKK
jgi:serine protease Do